MSANILARAACRNVQDDSLPAAVQATSLRMLHNLVDVIFARRGDPASFEQYRALLIHILDCFVSKLGAIKKTLPRILPAGDAATPGLACIPACTLVAMMCH